MSASGKVQANEYLSIPHPVALNPLAGHTPRPSPADASSGQHFSDGEASVHGADTASMLSASEFSVDSAPVSSITRISFTPETTYAIPAGLSYLDALAIANSIGVQTYEYVSRIQGKAPTRTEEDKTAARASSSQEPTSAGSTTFLLTKGVDLTKTHASVSAPAAGSSGAASASATSAGAQSSGLGNREFGVKVHVGTSSQLVTKADPAAHTAGTDGKAQGHSHGASATSTTATTSTAAATSPTGPGVQETKSSTTIGTSSNSQPKSRSSMHTGDVMWNSVTVVENEQALRQRPGFMLDAFGRIIKPKRASSGLIPDHLEELSADQDRAPDPAEAEALLKAETERSLREVRRQVKWLNMLAQWDVYTTSKSKVLKERIRKGIPHVFRRPVWQSLLGTQARRAELGSDFYESLLKMPLPPSDDTQICRDLPRAYQEYAFFRSPEEGSRTIVCPGQAALFRVLHAYAVYDPPVGYVQGMDGIAGLALMLMPEEEAFYFLERQMMGRGMRKIYLHQMVVAHEYVYIHRRLLRKHLPRLYAYLDQMAKADSDSLPKLEYTYCLRWYIKRFGEFAPEFCMRVMDMFLYEGDKALYRVALAVLMMYEPYLLAAQLTDSGDLLHMLTQIASAHEWQVAHLDEIMECACRIKITRAGVQALRDEYAKFRNESNVM